MDFKSAYIYLLKGYKIRLRTWKPGSYWQMKDNHIIRVTDDVEYTDFEMSITLTYVAIDDWEIVQRYDNGTKLY